MSSSAIAQKLKYLRKMNQKQINPLNKSQPNKTIQPKAIVTQNTEKNLNQTKSLIIDTNNNNDNKLTSSIVDYEFGSYTKHIQKEEKELKESQSLSKENPSPLNKIKLLPKFQHSHSNSCTSTIKHSNSIAESKSRKEIYAYRCKKDIQRRELLVLSGKSYLRDKEDSNYHYNIKAIKNSDALSARYHEKKRKNKEIIAKMININQCNRSEGSLFNSSYNGKFSRFRNDSKKQGCNSSRSSSCTDNRKLYRHMSAKEQLRVTTWLDDKMRWKRNVDDRTVLVREERKINGDNEVKNYFHPDQSLSQRKNDEILINNLQDDNTPIRMKKNKSVILYDRFLNKKLEIQKANEDYIMNNTPTFIPTLNPMNKKTQSKYSLTYRNLKMKQIETNKNYEKTVIIKRFKQNENIKKKEENDKKNDSSKNKKSIDTGHWVTMIDKINTERKRKAVPEDELYRLNIRGNAACLEEETTLIFKRRDYFLFD